MYRLNLYAFVLLFFCNIYLLEGQTVINHDSLFGYRLNVDGGGL